MTVVQTRRRSASWSSAHRFFLQTCNRKTSGDSGLYLRVVWASRWEPWNVVRGTETSDQTTGSSHRWRLTRNGKNRRSQSLDFSATSRKNCPEMARGHHSSRESRLYAVMHCLTTELRKLHVSQLNPVTCQLYNHIGAGPFSKEWVRWTNEVPLFKVKKYARFSCFPWWNDSQHIEVHHTLIWNCSSVTLWAFFCSLIAYRNRYGQWWVLNSWWLPESLPFSTYTQQTCSGMSSYTYRHWNHRSLRGKSQTKQRNPEG